jgi:hypothetical protein
VYIYIHHVRTYVLTHVRFSLDVKVDLLRLFIRNILQNMNSSLMWQWHSLPPSLQHAALGSEDYKLCGHTVLNCWTEHLYRWFEFRSECLYWSVFYCIVFPCDESLCFIRSIKDCISELILNWNRPKTPIYDSWSFWLGFFMVFLSLQASTGIVLSASPRPLRSTSFQIH